MKTYKLTYLDKGGNELTAEIITANNISDARELAAKKFAVSLINDLAKIKVVKL